MKMCEVGGNDPLKSRNAFATAGTVVVKILVVVTTRLSGVQCLFLLFFILLLVIITTRREMSFYFCGKLLKDRKGALL